MHNYDKVFTLSKMSKPSTAQKPAEDKSSEARATSTTSRKSTKEPKEEKPGEIEKYLRE